MSAAGWQEEEHSGRLDLSLWARIVGHARPYAWPIAGLSGGGLLLAGVEVAFPLVTGGLIDAATRGDPIRGYVAAYLGLSAVFAAAVWGFIGCAGRVATGVAADLRTKSFSRMQELSFGYFDTHPVGWLVSRLTSDCAKVSSVIPWVCLDLAWGTATIVGIVVAMLVVNAQMALAVLAIVPPLAIVTVLFQGWLLDSSRRIRRTNSRITASLNECITGVRTTKSLAREPENLAEFQELSGAMYRYSVRNALQSAAYLPIVIMLGAAGVGFALWRGGIELEQGMTFGELVIFMQYAGLLHMPIQELARRVTDLQAAQAAAERVQSLLDTEPEIVDTPGAVVPSGDDAVIRSIELRDVSFEYVPGEPVLRNVDLEVRSGQTIALVGATGGGKSTIVSLVARFYEPTRGGIHVNGREYRELSLDWLQSNLGVVLQVPHLFAGTIRDNIRYGRLDATDDEIEAAARSVNAHEFIARLDGGYDFEVGEGGARLSTGQRQLVALARAILADPQIFVMDEATSSVDTETERLIQAAIDEVLRDRIAFVIAHRLSTIRSADQILVVQRGEIIERGTHEELLARGGVYRTLHARQYAAVG